MKDKLQEDVQELINLNRMYELLLEKLDGSLGLVGREINSWALREKILGLFYKETANTFLVKYRGKEMVFIGEGNSLYSGKVLTVYPLPGDLWLVGMDIYPLDGHGLRKTPVGPDQGNHAGYWVLPYQLTPVVQSQSRKENPSPDKDLGDQG